MLVAAFSAASFVCSPLWGRVSDRFGRKPVLLVSLAGTAVGSLVTGLAGGLAVLLVGRIIDGASGASVSVAQAAAADLAGPADRHRLFGLLGAAFGVGFVAGPALGSLAALGGPRLPFFLAAVIAAVNTVVAARRLPETHRRRPAAAPRPGPDRGPGRWRRAGAPAGGGVLRPGRLQRVRGDLRPLRRTASRLRDRLVGRGLHRRRRRHRGGAGRAGAPGGGPARGAPDAAGRPGRQRRAGWPCWRRPTPGRWRPRPWSGLTVGQGLVQTTMVTQRGRPGRARSGGAGCWAPSSRSTGWPGWSVPPSAAPCSDRRRSGLPYVAGRGLERGGGGLLLAAGDRSRRAG